MQILIDNTTAAIDEPVPFNTERLNSDFTLAAQGLGSSDTIDIYFSLNNGNTWELLKEGGSAVTLTADTNVRSFGSGLLMGVMKAATTTPVTVAWGR